MKTLGRKKHPAPQSVRSRARLSIIATAALLVCIALPLSARGGREGGGSSATESGGAAGEATSTEIDYLGIAALMIRDGNFDRAAAALSEEGAGDIDPMRFHTLSGLVALHFEEYETAVEHLEWALTLGQSDPFVYAYLGQAYFATGAYRKSIEAIDKFTDIDTLPEMLGVKSQAQWHLGETSEAFATLDGAISRYPDRRRFLEQRIFYLVELDLTQEAAEESRSYLQTVGDDPEEYVTIGEALRRGDQYDDATVTLEMANLRFPSDERVLRSLSRAYLDAGNALTAARVLEQAARLNGEYTYDAAELYRRAGRFLQALYLNTLVADEGKRITQQLSILIEMKRYEEALALEPRLDQLGLLEDDSLRYAVAYLYYQVGDYDRSTAYVEGIRDGEYSQQAERLEHAIEAAKSREIRYF